MSKSRIVKCMFCRNTWLLGEEPAVEPDLVQILEHMGKRHTERGHICDKCNVFICEGCYLRNGSKCFCGKSNCRTVWLRELSPAEREANTMFQLMILGSIVINSILFVLLALKLPEVNHALTRASSLTIAFITLLVVAVYILRFIHLVPHHKRGLAGFGGLVGAVLGAGLGTMLAWGGDTLRGAVFGLGFVPWIIAASAAYAMIYALQMLLLPTWTTD